MENDEKTKLLYEKSAELHKYLLDWRYKLLAGYFVIISAIGYFLITWIQIPANYTKCNYILICICGLFVPIFFALINYRLTKLIWKCQNKAYLHEKDLGFDPNSESTLNKTGIYGEILDSKVRDLVDEGKTNPPMNKIRLLNPSNHSGGLNWLFIFSFFFYLIKLIQVWCF